MLCPARSLNLGSLVLLCFSETRLYISVDSALALCFSLEGHAALGLHFTAVLFLEGSDGTGRMPGCSIYDAKEVRLEQVKGETGPPIMVEADGDVQGQLPATFKVLLGAIYFLA